MTHASNHQLRPIARFAICIALFLSIQAAQAFTLKDSAGQVHRLADLKGKWVVVNFWATWCAPCIKEIPDLAAFAKSQGTSALVLGVAMDYENEREVIAFAKKVGMTYPMVPGEGQVEKQFDRVKGLPTTLVYDPSGKRVLNKTGPITLEQLNALVKKGD